MSATSPKGTSRLFTPPAPLDGIPAAQWAPRSADLWWSAYLPLAILAGVLVIHAVARDFYVAHVLPEGFGFLELTQFILAAAAAVLSARALRFGVVK
jgi:hypothetical protein